MKVSLQTGLGRQLAMTPHLQQAIRLLQLSALDLQTEIQTQVDANPLLEYEEPEEYENNDNEGDLKQYPDYQAQENYPKYRATSELTHNANITLQEHLLWQVNSGHFSEKERLIATEIVGAMDDNGFLDYSLDTILKNISENNRLNFNLTPDEMEAVLYKIQQCDPIGVGARNITECLSLQLNNLPNNTPWLNEAKILVANHLSLLAKAQYAVLQRKLKVSQADLKAIIRCIQSLNPRPGAQIDSKPCSYLVPELRAYLKQNRWVVELNQQYSPKLQLSEYSREAMVKADLFFKNKLQEARWFLKSLEKRNETLVQVASLIIEYQQDFFEQGLEAMRPLKRQDIARAIGMHEATISRITTHKYIHTPRGTYELKYFFSSGLPTQQGGECSSTAIRALIKKWIESEDTNKPLSDNQLSALLCAQGFQVARRTVTKYREALGLLPSYQRKK